MVTLPPFSYVRPGTVEAALDALADGTGRVLAGGQSLISAMNQGRERPVRLVDLNRIAELGTVEYTADGLRVGAMVRLATLRDSTVLRERAPLLWAALRHVAHVQIRTRATLGGNLSQADASSEIPAVAVALGATYLLRSSRGERLVPAGEYAVGPYLTSRAPDEVLLEVSFPLVPNVGAGFYEVARKAKDWPVIGAGAQLELGIDERISRAWVGVCGAEGRPRRLSDVEELLVNAPPDPAVLERAARLALSAEDYPGARSGAEYRRNVQPVVVERALRAAVEMLTREKAGA
jgi:carbon-monoxide dehydrogenase medium subunit